MTLWSRARQSEAATPLVAAVSTLVLGTLAVFGTRDFALDDAWIHLAYAKSVRLGEGLSYNPFDWELGWSSPLWIAVLAIWPMGIDPVLPTKLLGALLHALTAWAASSVTLDLARARASASAPVPVRSLALLAGVLAGTTPMLLEAATSGMEVPLACSAMLLTYLAVIRRHAAATFACAFMALLARPEMALAVGAFAAVLLLSAWRRRSPQEMLAPAMAIAGTGSAMVAWLLACWVRAGTWWPNAQLVKGRGGGLDGLAYLSAEVLPWQPWLVGLTGVWLLVRAIRHELARRRWELVAMLVGSGLTLLVIATTRPLQVGITFYQARYFAPFVAVFAIAIPFGLLALRPTWAVLSVVPIAIVTGLQDAHAIAILHEHERDTAVLHSAPARWIAEYLPADAVVLVEGAGAPRFVAPRSMTIVDVVGLNDHIAARLHQDAAAKICHFVALHPSHAILPSDFVGIFAAVFELSVLTDFVDPHYTQVHPPRAQQVFVFAIDGVRSPWRSRCSVAP